MTLFGFGVVQILKSLALELWHLALGAPGIEGILNHEVWNVVGQWRKAQGGVVEGGMLKQELHAAAHKVLALALGACVAQLLAPAVYLVGQVDFGRAHVLARMK